MRGKGNAKLLIVIFTRFCIGTIYWEKRGLGNGGLLYLFFPTTLDFLVLFLLFPLSCPQYA